MAPDKVRRLLDFEKRPAERSDPFIEKISGPSDREHRAIAGSSRRTIPQFWFRQFRQVCSAGGFFFCPNTKKPEELVPDPEAAKKQLKLLWISCGDSDRLISFSKRTHDYLYEHHVPHIYYMEPGVHDFKVWKNGLYMFSQFLFKPVVDVPPL